MNDLNNEGTSANSVQLCKTKDEIERQIWKKMRSEKRATKIKGKLEKQMFSEFFTCQPRMNEQLRFLFLESVHFSTFPQDFYPSFTPGKVTGIISTTYNQPNQRSLDEWRSRKEGRKTKLNSIIEIFGSQIWSIVLVYPKCKATNTIPLTRKVRGRKETKPSAGESKRSFFSMSGISYNKIPPVPTWNLPTRRYGFYCIHIFVPAGPFD